jgi:hypothetical protein
MVLRIKASAGAFFYAQTMPKLESVSSFRSGEKRQKARDVFREERATDSRPDDGTVGLSSAVGRIFTCAR